MQAAVAVAAPDSGADDAGFTVGGLSFEDPVAINALTGEQSPGYESIFPLFSNAPLLAIGSDNALGLFELGSQQFTVENSSGTTLGTVDTEVNDQNLLGIDTAQFTVSSTDPASGLSDSQAAEPFGNIDVPTPYDAIAPLDPGAALEALGSTSSNDSVSDNAFTIGSTTFDPGSDGFDTSGINLFSVAPLLNFTAGSLGLLGSQTVPTEDFEVYSGGADDGAVQTSLNYSDILGIDSTQFTVQNVIPATAAIQSALADNLDFGSAEFTAQELASALADFNFATGGGLEFGTGDITSSDVSFAVGDSDIDLSGSGITTDDIADVLNGISVADLPAVGTVYSVTDLGGGFENVYQAVASADGGPHPSPTRW